MSGLSVTLKLATSLDGKIATESGQSQWITGEAAREQGHRLRASHHAVLVGSQTVMDDDPRLTVRLGGAGTQQPLRAVADGRLRTPPHSRLVVSADRSRDPDGRRRAPVLIITDAALSPRPGAALEPRIEALMGAGVSLGFCPTDADGALDPACIAARILEEAAAGGLVAPGEGASILLEGGGRLAAAFLRARLIDRIEWFRASLVLGEEGRPGVGPLALDALAQAPRFERQDVVALGDDLWERYVLSQ